MSGKPLDPARASMYFPGAMPGGLQVVESTPDHAIAVWQNVLLYIWRRAATAAAAGKMQETIARMRRAEPGAAGVLLGVVEAGVPPPDAEAKAVLAETLKSGNGYLRASALVFEGQGFSASMVRAVATGLALLARTSFPHHVFADVTAGAAWLARHQPDAPALRFGASELAAALGELRDAAHG